MFCLCKLTLEDGAIFRKHFGRRGEREPEIEALCACEKFLLNKDLFAVWSAHFLLFHFKVSTANATTRNVRLGADLLA
jgi:hypothetical protein